MARSSAFTKRIWRCRMRADLIDLALLLVFLLSMAALALEVWR